MPQLSSEVVCNVSLFFLSACKTLFLCILFYIFKFILFSALQSAIYCVKSNCYVFESCNTNISALSPASFVVVDVLLCPHLLHLALLPLFFPSTTPFYHRSLSVYILCSFQETLVYSSECQCVTLLLSFWRKYHGLHASRS